MATKSFKRKVLTLEERMGVLYSSSKGKSCRAIAKELGVGKTQIQGIIKERDDIKKRWESGGRSDEKYSKSRNVGYEDLDSLMWEWFTVARSKSIPVSGRMIQERATMYAAELGHTSFTGSNGWLDRWLKRHNVHLRSLTGEAADVDPAVIEDWGKRLQSICEGYEKKDIFNADETGLFYRALPTRTMAVQGDEARGGKKAKDRITVLIACSATGEKLKPYVIGRSENPRCFRGASHCLPVTYSANKKAWMTSHLFQQWLDKLNSKMKREGRSILLFVDNCAAHPDVVCSNVKLVFLPPNTTSKLQPCDAGIIQTVKLHYRKRLLRHVLFHMEEANSASELAKKVTLLDAIMWMKSSWDEVDPITIQKCFSKCGFGDVMETEEDDEIVPEAELEEVLHNAGMTWQEYANCDADLATTNTIEDDWEENLLLRAKQGDSQESDEDYDDDDVTDDTPAPIVSVRTAASYLCQLREFAIAHSKPDLLELLNKSQTLVEDTMRNQVQQAKQTKLTEFFSKKS